jgi:hypothetical protein
LSSIDSIANAELFLSTAFEMIADSQNMKQMFATALKDHGVKGLVLTGFDDFHSDVVGIALVLQKYRPDWVT